MSKTGEEFYISGIAPIQNIAQTNGRLRNVALVGQYINDQDVFEGYLISKDRANKSHSGLVRGVFRDNQISFLYLSPRVLKVDDPEIEHLTENGESYDFATYFENIDLASESEDRIMGTDFMVRRAPFSQDNVPVLKILNQYSIGQTVYSTTLRQCESKEDLSVIGPELKRLEGYWKIFGNMYRKNPFDPKSYRAKVMPTLQGETSEIVESIYQELPDEYKKVYKCINPECDPYS